MTGLSQLTRGAAPAPHPDVETAFVGSEAVLLNVRNGVVYALNLSASAVWLLLDGAQPVRAIADELSDIVGLPAGELLTDVEAAIEGFDAQGLLARVEGEEARSLIDLLPPPDP